VRFVVMDAARGIAALAVLSYHIGGYFEYRLESAFLAVDAFFLMSGFVIAYSYEARLRSGTLRVLGFTRDRVIRLFPLYLAGLVLGLAFVALRTTLDHDWDELGGSIAGTALASALPLPTASVDWAKGIFPFNIPSWTLAFEFWGTILYACVAGRLGLRTLSLLIASSFVAVAVLTLRSGDFSIGWQRESFAGGAARFAFSFSFGVLLCRLRAETWRAVPGERLIVLLAAATFLLPGNLVWAQLIAVGAIYPAALVVLLRWRPATTWAGWVPEELGRLSYAIYILHAPLLQFVVTASTRTMGHFPLYLAVASGAMIVAIAAIATHLFDEPLRMALRGRKPGSQRLHAGS